MDKDTILGIIGPILILLICGPVGWFLGIILIIGAIICWLTVPKDEASPIMNEGDEK